MPNFKLTPEDSWQKRHNLFMGRGWSYNIELSKYSPWNKKLLKNKVNPDIPWGNLVGKDRRLKIAEMLVKRFDPKIGCRLNRTRSLLESDKDVQWFLKRDYAYTRRDGGTGKKSGRARTTILHFTQEGVDWYNKLTKQ